MFDNTVRQDSSVATATHFTNGLDVPGIESRWERDSSYPFKMVLGLPGLMYNGYRVSLQGVQWPGRDATPHLAPRLKRLCLYSTSGFSWPVLG